MFRTIKKRQQTTSRLQPKEKRFLLSFPATFAPSRAGIDRLDPPSLCLLKNRGITICPEGPTRSRGCLRDGAHPRVPNVLRPAPLLPAKAAAAVPMNTSRRLPWQVETARGGAGRLRGPWERRRARLPVQSPALPGSREAAATSTAQPHFLTSWV